MIKLNKKGLAWIPLIWGLSFLTAGIGYLVTKLKPAPEPSGIMGIPFFAWIIIVILILILLRKK